MIEFLSNPWPWYVSGPAIALIMFSLIFFGKDFGFSSNFKHLCAACGGGRYAGLFDYNWRNYRWSLLFMVGSVAGGWLAGQYLQSPQGVQISEATVNDLSELGISAPTYLQPEEIFGLEVTNPIAVVVLVAFGGFLVGFGTRWAGGCTSGHAISGLSNLQLPSLIAVIGFFIGGLITTFLLLPLIL